MHLRWHYQILLLSGAYGLSIIFISAPDLGLFKKYFFLWHLGLYGGATAFNSYWDKDKGPIGGLKNPPPMRPWMRWASFFMMLLLMKKDFVKLIPVPLGFTLGRDLINYPLIKN